MRRGRAIGAILFAVALSVMAGCEHIPADRYGIDRLRFEGMEALDGRALALCLASRERPTVSMDLGLRNATACGVPPFDSHARTLRLFRWSWTAWPLLDHAVFDRDLDRIVRWYRARGYPDARVLEVKYDPETAGESDEVHEDTRCDREGEDEGCEVQITVVIDEGEPVLVQTIELVGVEGLPAQLVAKLREAIELEVDAPFDEALYERSKQTLRGILAEASYARAQVEGHAWIGRAERRVRVAFRIVPGIACVFGQMEVVGPETVSAETVQAIAAIPRGSPYRPSRLAEARRALHATGAFAQVDVVPNLQGESRVVDVAISVRTIDRGRFSLGGGMQAGSLNDPNDVAQGISVQQWDVHFLARWEHRNFLGGLRQLLIEDRPRLVFQAPFPRVDPDQPVAFGNDVRLRFVQPAFLEARTFLDTQARWDYGPDPYEGFTRHQISGAVDVRRSFWNYRLHLSAGLHVDSYQVQGSSGSATDDDKTDWYVMFWQQTVRLDLRDREVKTRHGFYAAVTFQEAGYGLAGDWNYVRISPDIRGYIPLGPGPVLALRGRLGYSWIQSYPGSGAPTSNLRLGPVTQRYRGGGSSGDRGFLPTWLGDGEYGGVTVWELMAELRLPVTRDFWMSLFTDAGDVNREAKFRFNYPQMSVGLGLRYYTIIGPIRVDFGFRIPRAQVYGTDDRYSIYCQDPSNPDGPDIACTPDQLQSLRGRFFGSDVGGAVNITIGEPF